MGKLTNMMVFARVAKEGSFSAAAKTLDMSRAMVTRHVMQLENGLGVRLLNRTTRRISLTEVGSVYLERCLEIIQDVEEAELAVTQLHTEPRGTLKVSAPPSFGVFHLAPAIPTYLAAHPDVTIHLFLREGMVDVVDEGLDLAISLGELEDSSLVTRKLANARLVVCGSPEYLRERGVPRSPDDLEAHNCLVNSVLTPRDEWPFSGDLTIKVTGTLQANVTDALRMAAIKGLGLVMLPTYIVGQDLQCRRLQTVLEEFGPAQVAIRAIYPHRRHLSTKVRTFVDFLWERFQPNPYWEEWM